MADNGVTFGFRVEIEADGGEDNNVDENSIFASGSFGKLEFGNKDGAEDSFAVNGSNSGVDYGGDAHPTSIGRASRRERVSHYVQISGVAVTSKKNITISIIHTHIVKPT